MQRTSRATRNALNSAQLTTALNDIHHAGVPGVVAEVREGADVWRGASGVADIKSDRPMIPDVRHRMGSISKTFVAAAVMQQVERGQVQLDAPVGRYLSPQITGECGGSVTVRMLLNHTSGLADYLPYAYPSLTPFPMLAETSPDSIEANRFVQFQRRDLIQLGVTAPAFNRPGTAPGIYSNTNYLMLTELLEQTSGVAAEEYIAQNVIDRAGLEQTGFPDGLGVSGPHARMYESWFGMIDPPRDFSVYDMSWVGPAASVISTVADLNRFFGLLLTGEIVSQASLAQMQRTVAVISFEGKKFEYGLGLHKLEVPGNGIFWGHDGSVWGGGAISMTRADGTRQMSVAVNLQRWNTLDASGKPQRHPIDDALESFYRLALGSHDTSFTSRRES